MFDNTTEETSQANLLLCISRQCKQRDDYLSSFECAKAEENTW